MKKLPMSHPSTNRSRNSKIRTVREKSSHMLEQHTELRRLFLKAFVEAIISHLQEQRQKKTNIVEVQQLLAKLQELKKSNQNIQYTNQQISQKENIEQGKKILLSHPVHRPMLKEINTLSLPIPLHTPLSSLPVQNQKEIANLPTLQMPLPPPSLEKINILSLAKLELILRDPSIKSIECPGSDRLILVHKGSSIQTTGVSLTSLEIDSIMKEISERTKIPIIPGVFKAAFNNLIITAVVSEFVGTRFIIQKNYQRLQPPPVTQLTR